MQRLLLIGVGLWIGAIAIAHGQQAAVDEQLFEAARAGDVVGITAALDRGANVNAKSRYDVTALIFAAGGGRLDAVKLLVARGADVNAQDTFYRARAAEMAVGNGHVDVALFLMQSGSKGGGTRLVRPSASSVRHSCLFSRRR